MKKILILVFSNLKHDARVMRQINFLKKNYALTVCCFDIWPSDDYEVIIIPNQKLTFFRKCISAVNLLLKRYSAANNILHPYKEYLRKAIAGQDFDLIIANDVETLPLAFGINGNRSKVYFDAHEYAPRQFEDRLYWRIFFQGFNTYFCKTYIPHVSGMCTVNQGIANEYEKNFGIKPIIITNASKYVDITPKLKENYPIKLVHHGIFTLSRQPDLMIDLIKLLDDRFTLDLIYLVPGAASAKTKHYFEEFKIKALETGKIKILPPLKSTEIVPFLHDHYDVGIILIPPINFNYENALPNKLFECIQARIGIAAGPLREIAAITKRYSIGVVSEAFTAQSLASELIKLSLVDISRLKKNTEVAAGEMNAQYNEVLFLNAIEQII